MTRRERLTAKLEKRQEWAEKAKARSNKRFDAAHNLASQIPFGQPILVGHHSERHARRDADRIANNMDKGVEESKSANHHSGKAAGLADQLDRSIYSDDRNAITALEERIAEREAKAARMVEVNKAWRKAKGNVDMFAELANISHALAATMAETIAQAYSWDKQPYPGYELGNLRNLIRADKKRIEDIGIRQARTEKAEAAGGVTIEGGEWVRVTFAEKPARSILDALKAAGFYWAGGSWNGKRAELPESITA